MPRQVLITGVSSGIGHALAAEYLRREFQVYGLSRREPEDLLSHPAFHFAAADFRDAEFVAPTIERLLAPVTRLDLAILNAGILGPIDDLQDVELTIAKQVLDVNLWANKSILDTLFHEQITVEQVVTMSSGAAVNGNRGWGAYAISKAALNMMTKLYARERPTTHFCAFAPGLVDTAMQDFICSRRKDQRFPSIDSIRARRGSDAMPLPEDTAARFVDVFARLANSVESGDFIDIRAVDLGSGRADR